MKQSFNLFVLWATILSSSLAFAQPRGQIQNENVKSVSDVESSVSYPANPSGITGNLTLSSACIASPSSTTGLFVGAYAYDTTNPSYISSGTTIVGLPGSCSAGQIKLSTTANSNATGDTFVFGGQPSQVINSSKIWADTLIPPQTLGSAIATGSIGGGGGNSGKNFLVDAGFEGGAGSPWVVSGAVASANTSDFHEGVQSASLALSAPGTYTQDVTPLINLSGTNMEAGMWVKTSITGVKVCPRVNGVTLTSCNSAPSSGTWSYVSSNFVGPAQGTSIGIALVWSGSSGTVLADQSYVGQATNLNTSSFTSGWTNSGPTSITATGSAPTKGTTATDEMWWRQVGSNMEIRMAYRQTSAGSPGSGDYLFGIPSGYSIDTSRMTLSTTASSSGLAFADNSVGSWEVSDGNAQTDAGAAVVYDSTHVRLIGGIFATTSTNPMTIGAAGGVGFDHSANLSIVVTISVPIVGFAAQTSVQSQCASTGSCVNHLSASVTTACTSSPCTIASQNVPWLSSITRSGTGTYLANFASGFFTVAPVCNFSTTFSGSANAVAQNSAPTTSSVSFDTFSVSTTTPQDGVFTITCDKQGTDISSMSAPILVGSVTSSSTAPTRVEYATFDSGTAYTSCSSGSCRLTANSYGISSITYQGSAGIYAVNFSTAWSVVPQCFFSGNTNVTNGIALSQMNGSGDTTSLKYLSCSNTSASGTNCFGAIYCIGPR